MTVCNSFRYMTTVRELEEERWRFPHWKHASSSTHETWLRESLPCWYSALLPRMIVQPKSGLCWFFPHCHTSSSRKLSFYFLFTGISAKLLVFLSVFFLNCFVFKFPLFLIFIECGKWVNRLTACVADSALMIRDFWLKLLCKTIFSAKWKILSECDNVLKKFVVYTHKKV